MFRSFYAVTKDRKHNVHQYRLGTGEGVPRGEEIVDLKVAGMFSLGDIVSNEDAAKMFEVAALADTTPTKKARRKRATKE
jgi:hypothetical protein